MGDASPRTSDSSTGSTSSITSSVTSTDSFTGLKLRPLRSPTDEVNHIIPQEQLINKFDILSFHVNKIIGTGVFTTTGSILLITGSKWATLVIWIIGLIYTYLSSLVYIEYGSTPACTGGELVYLNTVWPSPKLFSICIFSCFFLLLGNTAGNGLSFAKYMILAFEPDKAVDSRLEKIAAIIVVTFVCFLNYFSAKSGRRVNRALCIYKVLLLVAVIIAGFTTTARDKDSPGFGDFQLVNEPRSFGDYAAALLLVVYSFNGWQNASYIFGDTPEAQTCLTAGTLLAVTSVGLLYALVSVAFMVTCTYEELISSNPEAIFARRAFGNNPFGRHGYYVLVAVSSFTNLMSVIYTMARVKQRIAHQYIIPWYRFWGRYSSFKTPTGGFILHWAITTIYILATPVKDGVVSEKGYTFIVSVFIYGHAIISVMIGCGLPKLPKRLGKSLDHFNFIIINQRLVFWVVIVAYAILNGALIVLPIIPSSPEFVNGRYPGYWLLVVNIAVFMTGYMWWLGLIKGLKHLRIKACTGQGIESNIINRYSPIDGRGETSRGLKIIKFAGLERITERETV